MTSGANRLWRVATLVIVAMLVLGPFTYLPLLPESTGVGAAAAAGSGSTETFKITGTVNNSSILNKPRGVDTQNGIAYVGATDHLTAVNISDKSNPKVLSTLKDASNLGVSVGVLVDGNYAYVVDQSSDKVTVVDVSSPSNMNVVATVSGSNFNSPRRVVKKEDYLYVTAFSSDTVNIIDVSDPESPNVIGSVTDTSKLDGARRASVKGNYAYVAASNTNRLTVLDITDRTNPHIVGSVQDASLLADGHQVRIANDIAYVSATGTNRLTAVDISDKSTPKIVSSVQDNTKLNDTMSLAARQDHYAYVAASGTDRITTVDISDPSNMVIKESGKDTSAFDNPDTVTEKDGYAYVTGINSHSLTVIQVGETISGRVTDTNGDPIKGASVQAWMANTDKYSGTTQEVRDKIRDDFDQASNPIPESWDSSITLSGVGGEFRNTDQLYVSATKKDIHNRPSILDKADVSDPQVRFQDASNPIVLTVWDPTDGGFLGVDNTILGNEYDRQLYGKHAKDTEIVVQKLDGSDSVIDGGETVVKPNKTVGGGILDPSKMHYAEVNLTPGYYRISATESTFSYVIQVGTAGQLIDSTVKKHTDGTTDARTNQSQFVQDQINSNQFYKPITVSTNETGHYSITVSDPTVDIAYVQAYKGADILNTASDDIQIQDIRNTSEEANVSGAVYLPSQPTVANPPADDVNIELQELRFPQYANISKFDSMADRLEELLRNQSLEDINQLYQQRVDEITREQLESTYIRLDRMRQTNPSVDDKYRALLSDGETVAINPSSATLAELRERVDLLQRALTATSDTLPSDNTTVDIGENTATARFTFNDVLEKENVIGFAHWSNGTTERIANSYITLDGSLGSRVGVGSTTVVIKDYPLGENKPAAVSFEVKVATQDGVGSGRKQVTNPTFNGETPNIASIKLSSLAPGPDDTVSIRVNPEDDSSFKKITDVEVYGPSGNSLTTAGITNGSATSFTTAGTGVHTVRLHMTTFGGEPFVETFRVHARDKDYPSQPSVQAASGPTGYYAIVGDRFSTGGISVESGGREITLTGVVSENGSVPNTIHVHTETISTAPDTKTNIRVLREPNGESVDDYVSVVLHQKEIPDAGIVYRVGDHKRPLTADRSQYGQVTTNENGTVITSHTQPNGQIEIQSIRSPSIIQQAFWYGRLYSPLPAAIAPTTPSKLLMTHSSTADAVLGLGSSLIPSLQLPALSQTELGGVG